jgi:hypothetical protein
MSEVVQECGKPGCPFYGEVDAPGSPAEGCPSDHIVDRHPGVDPDWKPSTYKYLDSRMDVLVETQVPIDDESALAMFHQISRYGHGFENVRFVLVALPGTQEFKMLPYQFVNGAVEKLG